MAAPTTPPDVPAQEAPGDQSPGRVRRLVGALRELPPLLLASITIASLAIAVLIATWVVDTDRDGGEGAVTPEEMLNLEANGKVTVTGEVVEGQPAPAASFPYLDGSPGSISDFAGKPLIVNFWASTCVPCRQEMPAFQSIHDRFGDRLGLLGVDVAESAERGEAFAEEMGVTYPLARDPQTELITAFGGINLPHTVVIAEDGTVLAVRNKALSEAELEELAELALG